VLGTLDAAERAAVAARRQREPELAAAIDAWQRRLAPLDAEIGEVVPREGLFDRIAARTFGQRGDASMSGPGGGARIIALERRVRFWKWATASAAAVAATLALVIGFRDTLLPQADQTFVAVFQKDDQQPAFLLSIDLKTRELIIRPVTAEPQQQRTYQLWIVDPNVSPVPRSLGLIESSLKEPTRKALVELEPAVLRRATFGISLEPLGGSPTGRPTGPALHGRLIPAGT
jgi:anti-sigma-K factor RskA